MSRHVKLLDLVIPLLAVQMLFAENEMALVLALVFLNITEILIPVADLNVFKIPTAIGRKLVQIINAEILVQAFVAEMLNAELLIIRRLVLAYKDILEIHLPLAMKFQKVRLNSPRLSTSY